MVLAKLYLLNGAIMEFLCDKISLKRNQFGAIYGYDIDYGKSNTKRVEVEPDKIIGLVIIKLEC